MARWPTPGQDEQGADGEQHHDERQQPELLADPEKRPQLNDQDMEC
jgi:hypothetical protein